LAIPLLTLFAVGAAQAAGGGYFVYFGTYTADKGQGIYVSRLDEATEQVLEMHSPVCVKFLCKGRIL